MRILRSVYPLFIFVLALQLAIVIHEMGHYVTALMLASEVRIVALGFGPIVFSWGIFGIGTFPVGGYVLALPTSPEETLILKLSGPITSVMVGLLLCIGADVAKGEPLLKTARLEALWILYFMSHFRTLMIAWILGEEAREGSALSLKDVRGSPSGFVYAVGVMSINLGLLNSLPIPPLDGSEFFLYPARYLLDEPWLMLFQWFLGLSVVTYFLIGFVGVWRKRA